ncbi:EexN family lipoprotein [Pseudomonas aeruginosa]|uniref:EexN family lipoprotein n=1 Tax=Pseudomonas aeruginosa TaxID=287 RepID=UPI003BF282B8
MKKIITLLLAAMLVACGKSEPVKTTTTSSPSETVESLVANPERLKALRQQCKTDRAKLGDELCNRVAEATNRRFLGDGKTPYTPSKE